MRVVLLYAALAISLVPRSAFAQANYRLAPVGGRTTLVGGTGLAFGRDSASAFLNPATVVKVDPGRLSFSVNFYGLSVTNAPRWYQPGPVDRARFGDVTNDQASLTRAGFDTLPSSLCIFLRVADFPPLAGTAKKELRESQARLGICIASVQNDDFSLNLEDYAQPTLTGGTRQAQTVRQSFRRIAAGPTYSMYVNNALAIGASLHVSRAAFSSIFQSTATTYGGGAQPISSSFYSSSHGDSYDLTATLGAIYRIGSHQTVALALEAPSLHAFGPAGLVRNVHFEGSGEATSSTTADGDFAANTPLRIAIGTGIEHSWGSAEVNVSYHLPTGPAYRATLEGRTVDRSGAAVSDHPLAIETSARSHGVVNIGVGGEAFVNPSISLLGGLGTDVSAARKGELTNDPLSYFPAHSHRVSASFGLGSHGDGGDLLVGGEFGYAWGERLAVNSYQSPPRLDTTFTQTYSLILVIAGTTSYKAIKRAVNDLTEAVDPKKKPEPEPKPPPAPRTDPALLDPKG